MPRNMPEHTLRTVVERAITSSEYFDNSEIQENQQAALNTYLGRNAGGSVPGDANERSNDVADTIEAVTAQVMPAFKGDEIAVFDPNGRDDVEQARLESKIVNQFIFDMNDGDLEMQSAVRDALLLRNGILKSWVPQEVDVRQERYQDMTDIELMAVQAPTADLQTVKVTSADVSEETGFDGETLFNLSLTRTTTFRRMAVEAIDPVNFLIEREYTSVNPDGATIVGERRFELRGDLLAQGYPKKLVDSLKATDSDTRLGSLARNRNQSIPHWDISDKSMDRIEIFELYMRVDFDGDGIPERRRIIYAGGAAGAGGTVMDNEIFTTQPYSVGTPFLYPHRHQGLSVYDKLKDLEKTKSRALTQYVNNLENANFPELVVADGEVAELDVTSRKSSGIIRADRVDAVRPIPVQDIGLSSLGFLQYMDQVRAERAGAALDMQSAQAQIAGESAYGVERLMSPREMLSNMMADTIGSTLVRQLFKKIHENLIEFFPGQQNFHIGQNQFVSADAGTWQRRVKVRITAGLSEHQRQQQRAVLEAHLLQQEKLWSAGMDGVLVDLETYYDTLVDWSKAGGLMTPRRYWINPASPEALQAQQQKVQQAEQQAAEAQAQQDKLFDTQVLIGDRENQTQLVRHMTELRFKYWDGVLSSEMEEMRIQAQGSEAADPDPVKIDEDQEVGRLKAVR